MLLDKEIAKKLRNAGDSMKISDEDLDGLIEFHEILLEFYDAPYFGIFKSYLKEHLERYRLFKSNRERHNERRSFRFSES